MKNNKLKQLNGKLNRYYEIQEVRALEPSEDTSGSIIEGLAIPYETETNVGNWFIEVIKRGALDGADLKDVPLFIHHQGASIPLARSRNNNNNSTMTLTVDDRGLSFKAVLDTDNNSDARALYSAVKRSDITGMSFAFTVREEVWSDLEKDLPKRQITKFEKIYEISALWSPQYDTTNVAAARDEALDSVDKEALESARSRVLESTQRRKKLLLQTLV